MRNDLYTSDADVGGDWAVLAGVLIAGFLVLLGLLALMRIGATSIVRGNTPAAPEVAPRTSAPADPSAYILDALLAPALQADIVPLRWADPRAAMGCGPGSQVLVDREPLRPGAAVPVVPFVLDWDAHGCHPFGPNGVRFDGRVRITVYPEDWGFSAMVEPAGLRVTLEDGRIVHVRRGGAALEA